MVRSWCLIAFMSCSLNVMFGFGSIFVVHCKLYFGGFQGFVSGANNNFECSDGILISLLLPFLRFFSSQKFNPKWYGGDGNHVPGDFPPLCQNVRHYRAETL